MIRLCELDRDNWVAFATLELPQAQRKWVASNAMTIAESRFYAHQVVLGICLDEQPVGLVAYCEDDELKPRDYWIYRFMIAPEHQNRGIGKAAFALVMERIIRSGADRVLTMCKPDNTIAYGLYEAAGFIEAGTLDDGDTLLAMPVERP